MSARQRAIVLLIACLAIARLVVAVKQSKRDVVEENSSASDDDAHSSKTMMKRSFIPTIYQDAEDACQRESCKIYTKRCCGYDPMGKPFSACRNPNQVKACGPCCPPVSNKK